MRRSAFDRSAFDRVASKSPAPSSTSDLSLEGSGSRGLVRYGRDDALAITTRAVLLLVTLLGVTAVLNPAATSAGSQKPTPDPPKHVRVVIDHYEIVADHSGMADEMARHLRRSAIVFEHLLGVPPLCGRVVVTRNAQLLNSIPPSDVETFWTLPLLDPLGLLRAWLDVYVPHEAAHFQFGRMATPVWLDANGERALGGGPMEIPDWLSEGVAVYHESEPSKSRRRADLRRDHLVPLSTFLTKRHPFKENPPPGTSGEPQPGEYHPLVIQFYSQSFALVEYFVDRSGRPFFRFMNVMLRHGFTVEEILVEWEARKDQRGRIEREIQLSRHKKPRAGRKKAPATPEPDEDFERFRKILVIEPGVRLGSLPTTIEALEADWRRCLAKKYPGHRGHAPRPR